MSELPAIRTVLSGPLFAAAKKSAAPHFQELRNAPPSQRSERFSGGIAHGECES